MPKKKKPSSHSSSAPTVPTNQDYLRTAQSHFDESCFSEAAADCSAAIDQQKTNPQAYLLRSRAYKGLGKHREALADCEMSIYQQEKNNPEAYLLSAELHFNKGDCYRAINDCEKAIEQKPQNPESYFLLGETQNTIQRYGEAIPEFTTAIEQKPHNPEAYRSRGFAYRKNGQYEEAIADFTMSITQQPHNPYAYIGRAEVHTINRNYKAAIDDLTTSISQRPKSSTAYFRRGEAYLLAGMYREALNDFEASTKNRHWNPSAFLRIGEIHLMYGGLEKAVSAFSVSITHQTNSRNSAFETLIPKHPTEQYASYSNPSDSFQAIMKKVIYSPSAYYGRGVAYFIMGEYAKAEADFTNSIEAQGRNPLAYLKRAQARHMLYLIEMRNAENPQETKDEKSKVLLNDNPRQAAEAKLKAAIEDCGKSLDQMPGNPETYLVRSNVKRLRGNYFEAFVDLLEAQSLGLLGLKPHIFYLRNLSIDKYLFDLNELIFANSPNAGLPSVVCVQTTEASAATNLATTTLASELSVQVAEAEVNTPESVTSPKHAVQVDARRDIVQNNTEQRAA